jgi:hypothetical protein
MKEFNDIIDFLRHFAMLQYLRIIKTDKSCTGDGWNDHIIKSLKVLSNFSTKGLDIFSKPALAIGWPQQVCP